MSVTDESVLDAVTETLESSFDMSCWHEDLGVVGTTFAGGPRRVSGSEVEDALRSFSEVISGVVIVSANDNSDTASGTVYEVDDDGGFEKTRTRNSGGPNTRRNWPGISLDGIRVDGGKY